MPENLQVLDLGRREYQETWDLQKRLVDARAIGKIPDTLLLVEHDPCLTTGKSTEPENILDRRFPVFDIERGGDVTYHGPGQLVGYPIVQLKELELTIGGYLRGLEAALILALGDHLVPAFAKQGATGVWVGDPDDPRKIASIGVAFDRWVSYHGFALNVTTDLGHFEAINPCGFTPGLMTSMQKELGGNGSDAYGGPDLEAVVPAVLAGIRRTFGYGSVASISATAILAEATALESP